MGLLDGIRVLNPVFWCTILQESGTYCGQENDLLCISYEKFTRKASLVNLALLALITYVMLSE